jgi:hypothetical protein
MMLAICVIVGAALSQFSNAALGFTLAHCCCGAHDVAHPCHCLDCPATNHHGASAEASSRPRPRSGSPAMSSCVLERIAAVVPAVAPAVAAASYEGFAPRTLDLRTPIPLPSPGPQPVGQPPEKPPRIA